MSDIHPTRRDFLRTAAVGTAGFALASNANAQIPLTLGKAKSCIFINMVGGPAHLDTFDPKPDSPSDVRGPFRAIQTNVPGIRLSELFPKLAKLTDKFSLIRSMNHDAPPVHECGFQLLNTGRLFRDGPEWPSVGAVTKFLFGPMPGSASPYSTVVFPKEEISTGVNVSHGQSSGWLGDVCSVPRSSVYGADQNRAPSDRRADQERYGFTEFGKSCRLARKFLGWGMARFITINQFSTVFDSPSWDCHADGGSLKTTLDDVRDVVAPSFDMAFSQLIEDLEERGLLESTLVVATGEFGRTPKLNSNGGRDHWAGCWTALVAGGGVQGGRVIGSSDRIGSEPHERPASPQELVASIFYAFGVAPNATIPGPDGAPVAVYPAAPVAELF